MGRSDQGSLRTTVLWSRTMVGSGSSLVQIIMAALARVPLRLGSLAPTDRLHFSRPALEYALIFCVLGHKGIVMDLNKFTEKSQSALTEAQSIATRNQQQAVDVEHLALALMEQEGGLVPRLIEKARISPDLLQARLADEIGRLPRVSGDTQTGTGLNGP